MAEETLNIVVLGSITRDTLLFVEHEPASPFELDNSLFRAADVVECLGGKGAVTARCLTHLGVEHTLIGLVGADEIFESDDAVAHYAVLPILDTSNRVWLMITPNQQVLTIFKPGSARHESGRFQAPVAGFTGPSAASWQHCLARADVAYLSYENSALIDAALAAMPESTKLVTDLNSGLLMANESRHDNVVERLLERSWAVLCNRDESDDLLRSLGRRSWQAVAGPRLEEVIVTDGDRGGSYSRAPFTRWRTYDAVRPRSVRCVVGAGDTFAGAYLKSRLVDRAGLAQSCRYAAQVAALKVATPGSSL